MSKRLKKSASLRQNVLRVNKRDEVESPFVGSQAYGISQGVGCECKSHAIDDILVGNFC